MSTNTTLSIQQIQDRVLAAPGGTIGGLHTWTSVTVINIAATKRLDSTGVMTIAVAAGSIDVTGTGAGKLDTGVITANTNYYTYAIAKPDGSGGAFIASTNPALPSFAAVPGYTLAGRIGSFKTKPASTDIKIAYYQGTGAERTVYWGEANDAQQLLLGGVAAGYTDIDCAASMVATATELLCYYRNDNPADTTAFFNLRPKGSTIDPVWRVNGYGGFTFASFVTNSTQFLQYNRGGGASGLIINGAGYREYLA